MTEKQWLKSTNPLPMLDRLGRVASDRQLRLFVCACARRVWHILTDERSRTAVEAAERFADGLANEMELAQAFQDATGVQREIERAEAWLGVEVTADPVEQTVARVTVDAVSPRRAFRYFGTAGGGLNITTDAACCTAAAVGHAHAASGDADWARKKEERVLASIMRDVFGNPFRSVRFLPAWRTDTVTALAKQIYEARDFGAMPILADALQEAGCDTDEVLAHCRDPKATHVRGCWVLDRVLDKS